MIRSKKLRYHPSLTEDTAEIVFQIRQRNKDGLTVLNNVLAVPGTQPQVGKLVVACHWSAAYSTEP